jgi:uncharacterized phiE125 gp8 family phage protein
VDVSDDDTLIDRLISVATTLAEVATDRTFISTTYTLKLSGWPAGDSVKLPRAPLQSVTSVTYYDVDDASQTLPGSVYDTDTASEPGLIFQKINQAWPDLSARKWPVEIVYVGGQTSAANVPDGIKQAMLLAIGHWYIHREQVGRMTYDVKFAWDTLIAAASYGGGNISYDPAEVSY